MCIQQGKDIIEHFIPVSQLCTLRSEWGLHVENPQVERLGCKRYQGLLNHRWFLRIMILRRRCDSQT